MAAIEPVARGRVWSGEDAAARGLVDELGGIERAIALAREKGRRSPSEKLEVVDVAPRPAGQGRGLRELIAVVTRERALLWADGVPDIR